MSEINTDELNDKEAADDGEIGDRRLSIFESFPWLNVGVNWIEEWIIDDTARRVDFQLTQWDAGIKQRANIEKSLGFGQYIKALRKARCLNRKNIAEMTNVSAEVLLCLEKGLLFSSEVKLLLEHISEALGTTPEMLYRSYCSQEIDDAIPLPKNFQPALDFDDPFDLLEEKSAPLEDDLPNFPGPFKSLN